LSGEFFFFLASWMSENGMWKHSLTCVDRLIVSISERLRRQQQQRAGAVQGRTADGSAGDGLTEEEQLSIALALSLEDQQAGSSSRPPQQQQQQTQASLMRWLHAQA
jgi:hypothetical protein